MSEAASRRVRWGILGDAKINRRLIPALKAGRNTELVALASRSREKAQAAAAAAGIPVACGSYAELLDRKDVDAVYIPLPNHLHAEWTLKAAMAGKHVLCEKPLALNAAEAQRMVDQCRSSKVRLMDGFMWPHHPRTAAIRKLLDGQVIGSVRRLTTCFSFPLGEDPANIRMKPEWGGGSLMDVGCYPVYFARWLFRAEPEKVFATAELRGGVDLRLDALMCFSGGQTALFDCAFNLPYRIHAEIVGSKGRIVIPELWLPPERATFEVINEEADRREIVILPAADQVVCMVENFSAAILEGRDAVPGPDEGVKTMKVLDALAAAARDGNRP